VVLPVSVLPLSSVLLQPASRNTGENVTILRQTIPAGTGDVLIPSSARLPPSSETIVIPAVELLTPAHEDRSKITQHLELHVVAYQEDPWRI
jgi:hypothetical protein